jgi:hypothetical protein
MNVGELRRLLVGVPDELEVFVCDDMVVEGYSTPHVATPAKDGGHGIECWHPCGIAAAAQYFIIGHRGVG